MNQKTDRAVDGQGQHKSKRSSGWALLLLVGVLTGTLLGYFLLAPHHSQKSSQPRDPATSAAESSGIPCEPTTDRPGPMIDLGVQASTGTAELPAGRITQLVRLAKQAGASVISTTVGFHSAQRFPGEQLRWGSLDATLAAAHAAGLDVRLSVYGMPDWEFEDPRERYQAPRTKAELDSWTDYVRALLSHVRGQIDYFEVWPEPNNRRYWSTGVNAAEFARLLAATEPVVRRLAPRAKVIAGGISGNDLAYVGELYDALGDEQPFDLLGLRPYSELAPDEDAERYVDTAYDSRFRGYRAMREVAVRHGHRTGVYITSFGYPVARTGLTDARRSAYLTDAMHQTTCTPYVRGFSWYYLHPTPWDRPRWTLLDSQLRPNRTYQALAAWSSWRDDAIS